MARLVNYSTLRHQEIPDEQVDEAIRSGAFTFLKGQDIPVVSPTGEPGIVKSDELFNAIESGFKFETAKQIQLRLDSKEFGDRGFEASLLGAARGITFGLSDVGLTKAGLVEPRTLSALEAQNPVASGFGEAGGVLLPLLFSGGTSLAARGISKLAIGVTAANKLGKGVGSVVRKALTSQSTSQISKRLIEKGVGATIEGATFGLGQLTSEIAMGNAEFNAEAVIGTVGFGGLAGGVLGLGAAFVAPAAEKTLMNIKKVVSKQFEKWVGNRDVKFLEIAGGRHSDFRMMFERAERVGVKGMEKETKELADFIKRNFKNQGEGSSAFFTRVDDIWKNVMKVRDDAIEGLDQTISQADDIYRGLPPSLKSFGPELLQGPTGLSKIREDILVSNYDLWDLYRKRYLTPNVDNTLFRGDIEKIRAFGQDILEYQAGLDPDGFANEVFFSMSNIRELRKLIDKKAGFELKDPSFFQETLQGFRRDVDNLLIEKVSKVPNGPILAQRYKDFKKDYTLAKKALKLLNIKLAAESKNQGIGLTGYISGGIGATAFGLPGAIIGIGLREAGRRYGDNALVLIMDRINVAKIKGIKKVTSSVAGFFSTPAGAIKSTVLNAAISTKRSYESMRKELDDLTVNFEQTMEGFIEMNEAVYQAAPNTYLQLQNKYIKGISFLEDKIPKPLQYEINKEISAPSEVQVQQYRRYREAVNNPASILDNLKNGFVTPEEVEVLKLIYPETYNLILDQMVAKIAEGKRLPFQKRQQLSRIFNVFTDNYFKPRNFLALQANFNPELSEEPVPERQQRRGSTPVNRPAAVEKTDFAGRAKSGTVRISTRK